MGWKSTRLYAISASTWCWLAASPTNLQFFLFFYRMNQNDWIIFKSDILLIMCTLLYESSSFRVYFFNDFSYLFATMKFKIFFYLLNFIIHIFEFCWTIFTLLHIVFFYQLMICRLTPPELKYPFRSIAQLSCEFGHLWTHFFGQWHTWKLENTLGDMVVNGKYS